MATKKTASLSSSLLVRRKPAAEPSTPSAPPSAGSKGAEVKAERQRATYAKALTLKLDQERYQALKMAGIRTGKSSQQILTEALDGWLARG